MPDTTERTDAERLKEAVKQMNGQSASAHNHLVEFVIQLAQKVDEIDKRTMRKVVKV